MDNLTGGPMTYENSFIAEGLRNFKRDEAIKLLEESRQYFESALDLCKRNQAEDACTQLVRATALWTHATWKEFLEADVVKTNVLGAYRPVDDEQ